MDDVRHCLIVYPCHNDGRSSQSEAFQRLIAQVTQSQRPNGQEPILRLILLFRDDRLVVLLTDLGEVDRRLG